jgi:type IV pilus assembly protein PilP
MKTLRSISRLAFAAVIVGFGLSACGGSHDDLHAYIDTVKAKPGSEIERLPDFVPAARYTYAAGSRRSPFLPDEPQRSGGDVLSPELVNRPREHLEDVPLDSLRMVGTLDAPARDARYGLVRDQRDGKIYRVSVGNFMGQNYGRILSITETEIRLLEVVPDRNGGYLERPASIGLSD